MRVSPEERDEHKNDDQVRAALRSWVRWIGGRIGLMTFGLVVGLLALELLLQAGALYTRATGRAEPTGWLTGRRRVMCVGDSNTFGLYLPRDQTYPSYLERIWNAATPAQPIEVLNLGVPGMNSSKLRRNFRTLLETFRPELVLMLVGANDGFILPVAIDDGNAGLRSPTNVLWTYSRVFRFFYMLMRGIAEYQVDVRPQDLIGRIHVGGRDLDLLGSEYARGTQPQWPQDLAENVGAMLLEAESAGARIVLLTYASHRGLYGNANPITRTIALNVPLIDLETSFRAVCPSGQCPKIFFGDQHLTAVGYQLAAARIWQELQGLNIAPPPRDDTPPFQGLDPLVVGWLNQMGAPQEAPAGHVSGGTF